MHNLCFAALLQAGTRTFGICPDLIVFVALPNCVFRAVKVVTEPRLLCCGGESAGRQKRKQKDTSNPHTATTTAAVRHSATSTKKHELQAQVLHRARSTPAGRRLFKHFNRVSGSRSCKDTHNKREKRKQFQLLVVFERTQRSSAV